MWFFFVKGACPAPSLDTPLLAVLGSGPHQTLNGVLGMRRRRILVVSQNLHVCFVITSLIEKST